MGHCTKDGGKPVKYDLPYDPPKGPKGQTTGPGLGGTTKPSGTQGSH